MTAVTEEFRFSFPPVRNGTALIRAQGSSRADDHITGHAVRDGRSWTVTLWAAPIGYYPFIIQPEPVITARMEASTAVETIEGVRTLSGFRGRLAARVREAGRWWETAGAPDGAAS